MLKQIIAATALATLALPVLAATPHDKPGFVTAEKDGRLWVFPEGSKELAEFEKSGEPAIHVSKIGEGPEGMTLKGPSYEVLNAYLGQK